MFDRFGILEGFGTLEGFSVGPGKILKGFEGFGEESAWILMDLEGEFRRNLGLGIVIWFWIAGFVMFVEGSGKDFGLGV